MSDATSKLVKFVFDCNNDSGYPNSHTAGLDLSEIREQWEKECPALEFPDVSWNAEQGRYVLGSTNVYKTSTQGPTLLI